MKISSNQMAAFTEVFRHRSVSKAATALGITQSAVTQHLAKLEKRMGATLFIRYRSGLEPTKPAQELFALTDRVRVLEQLVAEKIDAYGALSEGHLTVIANAPRPAMPIIAEFSRRYPGVKIAFSLLAWAVAMERVAARDVDIAIITEPGDMPGISRHELSTTRLMAVLRREHPLAKKARIDLAELARETMLLTEDGSLTQREVLRTCAHAGIKLSNTIQVTTYPVLKEAVLHGIGVGILLDDSIFPSRHIVMRPVVQLDVDFKTYVVSPRDKGDLKFVRAFVDTASDCEAP
ncbi:LysR family transcriptional regulator [Bradyrhizobium commune]|uniref:LysR family transcriptional regulator n=1 Tax=Bradyrhizobium commune TaxID=83627 RepID=A0A7S9D424_9BRAD|nr:LysR family transcriptional regulator [Bradyrhizobium commune]QPF90821.1 LysR family transcriptional regulator [Bradyrhizobium commune]